MRFWFAWYHSLLKSAHWPSTSDFSSLDFCQGYHTLSLSCDGMQPSGCSFEFSFSCHVSLESKFFSLSSVDLFWRRTAACPTIWSIVWVSVCGWYQGVSTEGTAYLTCRGWTSSSSATCVSLAWGLTVPSYHLDPRGGLWSVLLWRDLLYWVLTGYSKPATRAESERWQAHRGPVNTIDASQNNFRS